jgi:hypothetical protein
MNKNKYTTLIMAVGSMILAASVSAETTLMDYTFTFTKTVYLPTASDALNQNGRVWLGNFADQSNQLLSLSQVQAGGDSLLSSFRPLNSFSIGIVNGALVGADPVNGLSGQVPVGEKMTDLNYTVGDGQFANQPAYMLALSSTSDVWSTALADWQNNGALNVILIKSSSDFSAANGDPARNFGFPRNGLIFGTYTSSTVTAAAVPEPSTGALLVIGALGLATLRLRRKFV